MQLIILISLALWSLMEPSKNLTLVIFVGLIIAIASSTQDITVDALRIEQVGEKETKPWLRVLQWRLLVGGVVIN